MNSSHWSPSNKGTRLCWLYGFQLSGSSVSGADSGVDEVGGKLAVGLHDGAWEFNFLGLVVCAQGVQADASALNSWEEFAPRVSMGAGALEPKSTRGDHSGAVAFSPSNPSEETMSKEGLPFFVWGACVIESHAAFLDRNILFSGKFRYNYPTQLH